MGFDMKKIGAICEDFRTRVLGISLVKFAKLNNENFGDGTAL